MICDEMKRMFPPPLTAEDYLAGVERIKKAPEFAETHLQECAECRFDAELYRQHAEDDSRLLLIVAVTRWWNEGLSVMKNQSKPF